MPIRRLPRTDEERNSALTSGKTKKDSVPPAENVLSAQTTLRLDAQQPLFAQKMLERGVALSNQAGSTLPLTPLKERARMFISHFIQAFNNGIERGMFPANARGFYQLNVSSKAVPSLDSEEKIITWGDRLIAGDPLRVVAGGAPMAMPTIAEVNAEHSAFKAENTLQNNLKGAYDVAQEAVENLRPDTDSLIVRMWNEIETAYSEESISSKRRKSRQWGVVYVLSPGETPSPDDYSIIGNATDQVTGLPLAGVAIKVVETDETFLSDDDGNFFIPVLTAATYSLEVSKPGYASQTLPGIVVTDGEITEVDVVLVPVATGTGTVSGTVTVAGAPASGVGVSVDGVALPVVFTNLTGLYSLSDIPTGMQTVRAQLPASMGGGFQTQNVNVVAGNEVSANFSF
jgi:hypothetical protein